jgi:hypothetical protein
VEWRRRCDDAIKSACNETTAVVGFGIDEVPIRVRIVLVAGVVILATDTAWLGIAGFTITRVWRRSSGCLTNLVATRRSSHNSKHIWKRTPLYDHGYRGLSAISFAACQPDSLANTGQSVHSTLETCRGSSAIKRCVEVISVEKVKLLTHSNKIRRP